MNEDELIPGVAEALGEMNEELIAADPENEVEPGGEPDPETVVPPAEDEDIANRVFDRLQERAQQLYQEQEAERLRQLQELPLEEQYPDGVPVDVVEQRATARALQVIQVQQTVHDEVSEVLRTYEDKYGAVPVSVQNQIKTALRQVAPQNMRQGLGKEAARYFIAEALETGSYVPSAPKKTVKAPGVSGKQMSAGANKGIPAERSAEEMQLRSAFPTLSDADIKEMLTS